MTLLSLTVVSLHTRTNQVKWLPLLAIVSSTSISSDLIKMSVAHPFATANSTSLKARLIKVDIGLFNCAWPSLWLHHPFSLFDYVPSLQWFIVFWCYIQEAFWVNWPLNEVFTLAAVDCDGEKDSMKHTHTHTQYSAVCVCWVRWISHYTVCSSYPPSSL